MPPKTAFLEISFFQSLEICEYLQLPPNVRTNGSCNRLPGIACHFTCERGFNLIGSAIRWCDKDGFWTGTQPRCDGKLTQNWTYPLQTRAIKSNQTKVRILILDPFKSSAWKIHLFDWGSWLIKQFKVIQFFCMVRTMLQQFFVMFTWSISKIDKSSIIDVPSLNAIFDHLGSPVDTGSSTALMLAIILDPYSRSKLLQQSLLWLCSWFNISLQGWVNRYTIVTCKNIDDIRSRVDGGSSIVLWLGLAIIIDRYSRSNIVAYYFFMATRFIWYESTYDRKTHSFDNHRSRVVQDRQWS